MINLPKFKKGTTYVPIVSPVKKEQLFTKDIEEVSFNDSSFVKFIPASGAATRMFEQLYQYLDNKEETPYMTRFFSLLPSMPFYHDLK